jgi:hypothetical protein
VVIFGTLSHLARVFALSTAYGENGAYQRFERGEVGLSAFYDAWQLELGDVEEGNKAYRAYAARRSLRECLVEVLNAITQQVSLAMQNLPTRLGIDAREVRDPPVPRASRCSVNFTNKSR